MTGWLGMLAMTATGVFVATAAVLIRRPRRRLEGRVRPYATPALARLGRPVVAAPVVAGSDEGFRVRLGRHLIGLLHGGRPDPVLQARLSQSGLYDTAPAHVVAEHRVRQMAVGMVGGAVGLGCGVAIAGAPLAAIGMGVIGVVAGALRPAAAVDRAIDARRRRLRAEIPPLCQLIALRLRANGSVIVALSETAARTRGVMTGELDEALAQHRAGRPLEEALEAAAVATPEPEAARVHRLLAGAIRHGLDAAPELLRLAADARSAHLTGLRRDATRRRGAILLPTVGLLAPLMLLFIAAPLPGMVLGW